MSDFNRRFSRPAKYWLSGTANQDPSGLLRRGQGKPGNHQLTADIKAQALQLIRSRGRGMNPSAIWRILTTEYGLRISKETVRKMMIAEKTWHPCPSSKPESE